jgi:hypothetical protein
MTRLAKDLKNRVWILKPYKEINVSGGFDRGYEKLIQVWSKLVPIAQASRDISHFAAYIRGTQVASVATHKMKVRRVAVEEIGSAFATGFNRGFAVSGSLQILKSEYYVLDELVENDGGIVGNLYRIVAGVDNNSDHEYLEIRLKEVEEQGTGAAE